MIKLRLEKESAFYNSFDPSGVRIDHDVYDYLKSFCTEMEEQPELYDTIQIFCSGPFDTEKAKRTLVDAIDREQKDLDQKIRKNRRWMHDAYLMAAVLSILGFVLSKLLNVVFLQMITFLGTMAAKDALKIQTKYNPDLEQLKRYVEPFRNIKLEVVRDE